MEIVQDVVNHVIHGKEALSINIQPIPAFQDNYIWWIQAPGNPEGYVVDPGDGQAVQQFLDDNAYQLKGILITHHHRDHTGGIQALTQPQSIPVYGPSHERINGITHPLSQGDTITLELATPLTLKVLEVPGHTLGHIAYYSESYLFPGDTLFLAGCGRLFEGTAEQMFHSLSQLKRLPPQTLIYCAHEYTLSNLAFAKAVEPTNDAIDNRIDKVKNLRASNQPSVPATLEEELKTNPFLRTDIQTVQEHCEQYAQTTLKTESAVFKQLRLWKDTF